MVGQSRSHGAGCPRSNGNESRHQHDRNLQHDGRQQLRTGYCKAWPVSGHGRSGQMLFLVRLWQKCQTAVLRWLAQRYRFYPRAIRCRRKRSRAFLWLQAQQGPAFMRWHASQGWGLLMLRPIQLLLLWGFCGSAGAILVTMERLREMTAEEVTDATGSIRARYPNAKIGHETTAWYHHGDDPPIAFVAFESAWSRVNSRFCQAIHGELRGSLSPNGVARWEILTSGDTFRVLYEQPSEQPCVANESSRRVGADDDIGLDTVAWALDHETAIWSQYLAIAMKRYGAAYELPTVPTKLVSVNMTGKNLLAISFSGEGHISYEAHLRWYVDRWIVTEAYVAMP